MKTVLMFSSDLKGIRKTTETTKEWHKLKMFRKLRLKVTKQKNMKRVDRTQEEIRKKTHISEMKIRNTRMKIH